MRRRSLPLCSLLALVGLTACAAAPSADDWVAAVVAAEPMFGGGAALEQRLFSDRSYGPVGDALQREQYLREQRAAHDQQAAATVRELVSAATARQVLPFLHSPAGNALAAAETMTLGLAWYQGDDFPRRAAQYFSVRANVGNLAVQAQLEALRQAVARGQSPSPAMVAMVLGGACITPDDADAIAAFFATDGGQRWCELQCAAMPRTDARFRTFHEQALGKGFLRYLGEPMEDLILPAAKFAAPAAGGR